MTVPAIRTVGLSRRFATVQAVDNLTIEIPQGTVFGFLGPNGSGKTTTIRLLLGLLEPSAGRAEVLGFDTRSQGDQIRQQTGALLEHHGLYERLTAEENLEFYGRVARMSKVDRRQRIQALLTHLGLWERRDEPVDEWSRGMKQKLAVARALIHRPPLIFLDEPTAGLDPVAAAALREDLALLAAESGVTVFLTTHNLVEAEKLCSLIGVIRQGKLVAVGHPDELRARSSGQQVTIFGTGFTPQVVSQLEARPEVARIAVQNGHLQVRLRYENGGGNRVAPLITQLVQAGVQVEEVHKNKASLEEIFLTLMQEEEQHPSSQQDGQEERDA